MKTLISIFITLFLVSCDNTNSQSRDEKIALREKEKIEQFCRIIPIKGQDIITLADKIEIRTIEWDDRKKKVKEGTEFKQLSDIDKNKIQEIILNPFSNQNVQDKYDKNTLYIEKGIPNVEIAYKKECIFEPTYELQFTDWLGKVNCYICIECATWRFKMNNELNEDGYFESVEEELKEIIIKYNSERNEKL